VCSTACRQTDLGLIIQVVSAFSLTRAVWLGESTHRDADDKAFHTFRMQIVDGDLQI